MGLRTLRDLDWRNPQQILLKVGVEVRAGSFPEKLISWGVKDVIGFRLCMNPEGPVGASAQGSAAPAASTSATSNGNLPMATSERPKPLVLNLGGGVKMEMVGCPAGKFMQRGYASVWDGSSEDRKRFHVAEITRPFWFGKYPVTISEWNRLMPSATPLPGVKQTDMDPRVPIQIYIGGTMGLSRQTAEEFMSKLTRKFKHLLPPGYVFRWPTDAEWEYALRANSTDPSDPFSNLNLPQDRIDAAFIHYDDCEKYWLKRGCSPEVFKRDRMAPYPPVGSRTPNAWGIYDMGGPALEALLDSKVEPAEIDKMSITERRKLNLDRYILLSTTNNARDPLTFEADKPGGKRWTSCRWGFVSCNSKMHPVTAYGQFGIDYTLRKWFTLKLRLVVGPDLLKERGITPPKLDK